MAAYEEYRRLAATDPEAKSTVQFGEENGLLLEWEWSFYRPALKSYT